ncbi:MAG TPA: vitamin K epoxide reductase family protein [Candidatus Paceibacterota bacterium]|nr:vitamin K epoxide reductase family protein [Candidatus Paceibacterota bacterium]
MKRIGVTVILVLAFCGLADSAYLTQHELTGTPLICNIQNLSGCNTVATSPYSHLFGVPLAEYGVFFYGILFVLAALELVLFDRVLRRALQWAAVFGVVSSLYFTFIQIFLIGAFCIYCTVSAVIALLILIFASLIEPMPLRKRARQHAPMETTPPPHLSMPPTA